MRMTVSDWKALMQDLLDGIEKELGSPVSTFQLFRERLNEHRIAPKRKQFERDLEAFLESKPFLRAATRRYLRKKAEPALETANVLLRKAEDLLAQWKSKRSRIGPN